MILLKKLRLSLFMILALFVAGTMIAGEVLAADWFNEDWHYRRQITIDHNQVEDVAVPSTTYADFPLLVFATGLTNINADGTDIRFTASDGTTELPREIESYSSGTLYAWVKVTLTKDSGDSTDDVIFMYYGNPAAAEPAPGSTYGSENVWDSNFVMVQHLQETPANDVAGHIDSTSNTNNGTPRNFGGVAGSTTDGTGKVDGADEFDGEWAVGDDYVDLGDMDFYKNNTIWSVSAWVKGKSASFENVIFGEASGGSSLPIFQVMCYGDTGYLSVTPDSGPGNHIPSNGDVCEGPWHYFVVTDNNGSVNMYIDGSLDKSTSYTRSGTFNNFNQSSIGGLYRQTWQRFFNGIIDEVRVSNIVRSAGWIETSYNNQNNPSSFITVGLQAISIPTMTEWGMIIFMLLAALVAAYYLRKYKNV